VLHFSVVKVTSKVTTFFFIVFYNIFTEKTVMADPRIKTLKIKTGVVKRLTKEKLMYIQETEQQQEKVEKLKKAGELPKLQLFSIFI